MTDKIDWKYKAKVLEGIAEIENVLERIENPDIIFQEEHLLTVIGAYTSAAEAFRKANLKSDAERCDSSALKIRDYLFRNMVY